MKYIFTFFLFHIIAMTIPIIAEEQQAKQLNLLGEKYHFAQDVPQDFNKAKDYYLQAAALGSSAAANHLGRLYLNGEGVEKDREQAEEWYRKSAQLDPSIENRCINNQYPNKIVCALVLAAMQDSAPAQYQLGELYENGKTELKQDFNKAFEFYLKAAEKDHIAAIFSVIHCYEEGIGTMRNSIRAEEWKQRKIELEKKLGRTF